MRRTRLAAARSATAELFNAEVADVGRLVGEQVLKATGSEEETQALQAVVQSFVAANALDLDMSPKQFWQEYGATLLGEPDVKRDAKGNLVEVEGQAPGQWKADAFSQSWGKFEKFKSSIVDIQEKFVGSYKELTVKLRGLLGKELKLGNSGTATVSSNGLNEIVRRPDAERRVNDAVFKTAVSHVEELLANSIYGWSAPDRKRRPDIDHVEKHFSGFVHEGRPYSARITIRVIAEPNAGKKVYEVDAIEIESLESGLEWVNRAYEKDMALTKNSSDTEAPEEGTRRRLEGPLQDVSNVTPISPDVQELIEALSHLRNNSFSQASKGDFYLELKLIARWKSADRSTLLHETGHMFLEARMQAYVDMLKRGGPKTEEEKQFAENM